MNHQKKQSGGRSAAGGGGGMQPFFTMYSSKAEQILSRYRPIAPKPPAPKPGDSSAAPATTADSSAATGTAPQSSSSVSLGYNRRGRKRSSDTPPLSSPRAYKRAAAAAKQQGSVKLLPPPGGGLSVVPVVVEMGRNVVVTGAAAVVPAAVTASTASSSSLTMVRSSSSCDQQQQQQQQLVMPSSAAGRGGTVWKMVMPSNVPLQSSNPWCDRFRFGRAAAAAAATTGNAPHQHLLPEDGGNNSAFSPTSYEQWKNLDRHHHAFLPQQQQQQQQHMGFEFTRQQHQQHLNSGMFPQANSSDMGSVDSILQHQAIPSCRDADGEDEPKLVTLSLLPDTPSHPRAESASSSSGLRSRKEQDADFLDRQQQKQEQEEQDAPPLKLSLFSGASDGQQSQLLWDHDQRHEQAEASHISSMDRGAPLIDVSYLEQAYGSSSDPAMLTSEDASNRVLWTNLAYNKAISERIHGKAQQQRTAGPYIDPLGLPTQLGRFTFRSAWPGECSGAILWGFLKKFMLRDNVAGGADLQQQQQAQEQGMRPAVIAPQPVRTTGARASVSLESVSEANSYTGYLVGSLDSVEAQLERSSSPAFVTDRSNRVRWVNSAFGQLVGCGNSGRFEQDSNSTSTAASCGGGGSVGAAAGASSSCMQAEDVSFSWHTSKSPYSAVSLLGQVRLDWLDPPAAATLPAGAPGNNNNSNNNNNSSGSSGRRRCSLASVPCEMRRLDEEHFGSSSFVWRLSLNVGSGNRLQELQQQLKSGNVNSQGNVISAHRSSSNSDSSDLHVSKSILHWKLDDELDNGAAAAAAAAASVPGQSSRAAAAAAAAHVHY